jgi:hypothetical protein
MIWWEFRQWSSGFSCAAGGWLMAVVDDAEYRDVPREIVIEALNDVLEAFSKNRSEATE